MWRKNARAIGDSNLKILPVFWLLLLLCVVQRWLIGVLNTGGLGPTQI